MTPQEKKRTAYWLTRVCDEDHVEDVNFTHHDRVHNLQIPPEEGSRPLPTLQNGKNEDNSNSSEFSLNPQGAYEKIRVESVESKRFSIEPVPRFTKRPGDFVLQGSNNTSIVLGTDRGWSLKNPSKNQESTNAGILPEGHGQTDLSQAKGLTGAIDITAGRGRYYDANSFPADKDPEMARARVVENAEKNFEVDKNIANDKDKGKDGNLLVDSLEGDPDFINDASKIYVAIKTNVDANFGTVLENIPEAYDKDAGKSTLQNAENAAAIALKSDEIRIIARKTKDKSKDAEYSDAIDINGSIRIIKEGDPKKDGASIYLLPDGTIQITGSKIMMGRGTTRDSGTALDAHEDHEGNDVGFVEPYMRYTEFAVWADGLIDAINKAFENNQKATNGNGDKLNSACNAGSAGGGGSVMGSPNAGLGAALSQGIGPAGMSGQYKHAGDKAKIEEFKSDKDTMKAIRSKRVFGE